MNGLYLSAVTLALRPRVRPWIRRSGERAATQRPLVDALTLTVAPGEIVTVMGPSGSGKSTLLAFISGHLDPAFEASGAVRLAGETITDWPAERRRIGMLFQDAVLFPHLTVGENLAFGLVEHVRDRRERQARITAALERAGLAGMAGRDPVTLSGGERARVALMRALLAEPKALLLDEPFARLDVALRDEVRRFVFDHARAERLPVLLVTHDSADAAAAGGPVLSLPIHISKG
jgi:putative thiamine transport system ATP-binding protein